MTTRADGDAHSIPSLSRGEPPSLTAAGDAHTISHWAPKAVFWVTMCHLGRRQLARNRA